MAKREKVTVRICVGTACFVQGGADLLLYDEFLDPIDLANCEIEGVSCLGRCKEAGSKEGAPFVQIGDAIYGDMTEEKLCKLVSEAVHA
ncbi:MAG TPA: NAD(P)H-dependent oxidoreductase subunit E [Sphaerochaeta sp.]|nr:NAD(P)H-dependent oxidoreductase subunit E [Sphaerochaeta sp.]